MLSWSWTYWTRKSIHVTAAGLKLTQTIFANLAKWLIFVVRSYLYSIVYCVFLTSLSQMLIEWIFALKLPERQWSCCFEKHDISVTSMGGKLTTLKLVTEHSLVQAICANDWALSWELIYMTNNCSEWIFKIHSMHVWDSTNLIKSLCFCSIILSPVTQKIEHV